MALSPREKELLGEGLAVLSKEQLAALKKPLVALRDSLDEANSAFPATKEFLNARGCIGSKNGASIAV